MWKQNLFFMLLNNLVLVVFLFFVPKLGKAQIVNLRNPFQSWFYLKTEARKQKELSEEPSLKQNKEKVDLKLKGILTGKRNLAIINDEIVGEGDVIEGRKIVKIEKKKVVLEELEKKMETVLELSDEL